MKIKSIRGVEILDSRGNPTVEAAVELENGVVARAAVPSGASTGTHEAVELRDGDNDRYGGKGVQKAVQNVNTKINAEISGMEVFEQEKIDQRMIELDGSDMKGNLGANAILAVSIACVKASALAKGVPTYRRVAEIAGKDEAEFVMPVPMMNVLNGGKHAINSADMQEFMIMPVGASSIAEAVRYGAEVFHVLGSILKQDGHSTTVGDEGGYAPSLGSNEAPLKKIMEAIQKAGYEPGKDLGIAMDPAASEFYEDGKYVLKCEDTTVEAEELISRYAEWVEKYPILSIEDGLDEDDWDGFVKLNDKIGSRVQLVGDDLFVTNVERLRKGIDKGAANSILIKLNQIGSVSETIAAIKLAEENNFTAVVSHRSGETEDPFIADFVVGMGTGQIKTGSLSRSDRVAKYNQLIRIEKELGDKARMAKMPYAGK